MSQTVILGRGPLARAIETASVERGDPPPRVLGRPRSVRHEARDLATATVVVDASTGAAVLGNLEAGLEAGCRRFVLAATGWQADGSRVERALHEAGAAAVAAPNLSLGAAVFLRLVERAGELLAPAGELFAPAGGFDPFVMEWHRRGKRDRPSGTARLIVERLQTTLGAPADDLEVAAVRAGASPGMHLVAFDSPGETLELRLTARDRSAYAAGALAAIDWLLAAPRAAGCHPFEVVVDDLFISRQLVTSA